MDGDDLNKIYQNRFRSEEMVVKDNVWRVLGKYFSELFFLQTGKRDFSVIDLASGSCEFINHVNTTGKKLAVDLNPEVKTFAKNGTETICASALDFSDFVPEKYDIVFVSNFFEHLNDPEELLKCLAQISKVLKPGGILTVLQPNIDLLDTAYWDFIDHKLPVNAPRLQEAAQLNDLYLKKRILRFLPYSTCSRMPKWPWLVRLYLLLLPFSGFLFGKQSLFIFEKGHPSL